MVRGYPFLLKLVYHSARIPTQEVKRTLLSVANEASNSVSCADSACLFYNLVALHGATS
jgi:hypothetical protein